MRKGNKKKKPISIHMRRAQTVIKRTLTLTYDYDKRDRVEKVNRTAASRPQWRQYRNNQTYAYDETTISFSEKDWNGNTTTHTYDDLNRIKSPQMPKMTGPFYAYVVR